MTNEAIKRISKVIALVAGVLLGAVFAFVPAFAEAAPKLGGLAATAAGTQTSGGPTIVTQPQSQSVAEGEDASFSVAAEAGTDFTISLGKDANGNDISLQMVWVAPGTFQMGSPEDELGRSKDEVQHEVSITHGYWIGRFEVTQAQYQAIMGLNRIPEGFRGDDRPMVCVSQYDALNFCGRLTRNYRLFGINGG